MNTDIKIDKSGFISLYKRLYSFLRQEWSLAKVESLKDILINYFDVSEKNNNNSLHNLVLDMRTAIIAIDEIGLKQPTVCAVLLFHPMLKDSIAMKSVKKMFGEEVETILTGLITVNKISDKPTSVESENYIKLLISIAEDIRVVFIMIAQQLQLMRDAKYMDSQKRVALSVESIYLYAPLSHRLGLYKIKSELEDLSLKYTDRDTYDMIAQKLNETKRSRDKYINDFIQPVINILDKTDLEYDIKGRTKSIHSINNKLKKQQIEFEKIYDLFAIRIILDSPEALEKAHCWQVYSIITDMYQPNPKRLKDWLSIPKSNGYESLHITVMGPNSKWVEVQIRTRRMDEIAERGLAAHWKYKGIKGESSLDNWISTLRESIEDKDSDITDKLGDFKLDLYDEEIFVFTPKGELKKLPKGASILDFAFSIHTKLGSTCVSGKVNGKNVPIKHILKSGDQVEIQTSPSQYCKQDWLSFVKTSKARTKIRQLLKEEESKQVDIAKETLSRRMKNRKIDLEDPQLMQLIKKLKYRTVTDFYADIASEKIDVNWVIDRYVEMGNRESAQKELFASTSADQFVLKDTVKEESATGDELIIDQDLTGVDYKLAKCCNPIYGDEIFGFVSTQGIKIHRTNCPNATDMFSRFGYRVINARWSGNSSGSSYISTLKVVGNDQINIVSNLISIISKENGIQLRSISIDSDDGLFQGSISVLLANTSMLEQLMKKLRAVKGVKSVSRLS